MPTLNQSQFAKLAGTSQAAVSKALKRGALVAAPDGRLDPKARGNRVWLEFHAMGFNAGARLRPRSPDRIISPELQAEIDELLAECRRDTDPFLQDLLAEFETWQDGNR